MKPLSSRTLIACIAVTTTVVTASTLPLGVAGEWTWTRHVWFQGAYDLADRIAPAVLVGLFYFVVAAWGRRRIAAWFAESQGDDANVTDDSESALQAFSGDTALADSGEGIRRPLSFGDLLKLSGLYLVLMAAAYCWLLAAQHSAPMIHRDVKPLWVLYDPGSSGYFLEAAFHMDSVDAFLEEYEERMQQGDVLHVGTHPPGLFLLAKACLTACESSPLMVTCLETIRSQTQADAFRYVESEARFGPKLLPTQLAALQLLSLLSTLAVVLTIIPLAVLSNWLVGRQTAWMVTCLWPTLPCLAIFLPKSDLLFPLTCTIVLALAVPLRSHWKSGACAVLAGMTLFVGLTLSLAHLPVIALLGAYVAFHAIRTRGAALLADASRMILMLATTVVAALIFSRWANCDIFGIWKWNLTNHEAFYGQHSRTYGKWLLVNPAELAFAVGLPVFVAAVLAFRHSAVALIRRHSAGLKSAEAFCAAAMVTIAVLWLSGKNQGEAARLWCFLTPWLLIAVGLWLRHQPRPDQSSQWQRLLLVQLLLCLVVVSQVSGFLF